jgi:hypothetical protein
MTDLLHAKPCESSTEFLPVPKPFCARGGERNTVDIEFSS